MAPPGADPLFTNFPDDKEKRKEKVPTDLLSAQKYLRIQLPNIILSERGSFRTTLFTFFYVVVKPAEQFGQNVLNTPLPSLQQLSGMPLLLLGSPNLLHLLPEILQAGQTPIAQEQQPTTIGSLLNSAATSSPSSLNSVHFRTVIKHLFKLLTYKLFALFSSLYSLSNNEVVSYD